MFLFLFLHCLLWQVGKNSLFHNPYHVEFILRNKNIFALFLNTEVTEGVENTLWLGLIYPWYMHQRD